MKARLIILGVLIFVFSMLASDIWIFSLGFGAGNPTDKTIILNFDDGPRPWVLKELLPVLKKYNVPGTFFVMGWAVPENKEIVKKMHDAGHEIENHSYGHDHFIQLFNEKGATGIKTNLKRCAKVIFEATGRYPRFFRPRSWEINDEIEKIVIAEGYTVMKRGNPDINTEDYLDFEKRHPPEILIEKIKRIVAKRETNGKFKHVLVFHELPLTVKALEVLIPYFQQQGYKFIRLDETGSSLKGAKSLPQPGEIKAIYLGSDHVFSEKKIAELEKILVNTNANGIVIDFKDSNSLSQNHMANLVKRFKKHNIYTIARIVAFQDTYFARRHPEAAIKTSSGEFWWSGRKVWKRYWLDPASSLVQDYNIEIAKRAIDAGFDEIQFDYLRFPTDGDMKDMRFPVFNPTKTTKAEVMKEFFAKMKRELKAYSPNTLIGIDVFGEVFLYGKETGIGQTLPDIADYFDVICPMAYPSHYMCGEFGVKDPTAHPYKVYYVTLQKGLQFLAGKKVIIRPWIQDFTWPSIYNCGPKVYYDAEKVHAEIQAGCDLGIHGFMLWNASNNFSVEVLK